MGILGTAISAGANLLGGILGSESTSDANKANAKLTMDLAKNAVQYKVADALKAGIHPLYALGAPVMSPSPSYVGDQSMPNAMMNIGQDISRAVEAGGTAEDRVANKLKLENMGLQNDLLRSQIARSNSAQIGPGINAGSAGGGAMSSYRLPNGILIPGGKGVPSSVAQGQHGEVTDIPYGIDFFLKLLRTAGPGEGGILNPAIVNQLKAAVKKNMSFGPAYGQGRYSRF